MYQGVVATAERLIANADAHVAVCEQRARVATSIRHAASYRHEADAWRRYADRLWAIAMRHDLIMPPEGYQAPE